MYQLVIDGEAEEDFTELTYALHRFDMERSGTVSNCDLLLIELSSGVQIAFSGEANNYCVTLQPCYFSKVVNKMIVSKVVDTMIMGEKS